MQPDLKVWRVPHTDVPDISILEEAEPITTSCFVMKNYVHKTRYVNPSSMLRHHVSVFVIGDIQVPRLPSMGIALYPESALRPNEVDFVVASDEGLVAVVENRALLIDNGNN